MIKLTSSHFLSLDDNVAIQKINDGRRIEDTFAILFLFS